MHVKGGMHPRRDGKTLRNPHSRASLHPLQSISWHQTCWNPWYHHASP